MKENMMEEKRKFADLIKEHDHKIQRLYSELLKLERDAQNDRSEKIIVNIIITIVKEYNEL